MLKDFTYTVKLVIQHKILGTLDFITQDFNASIEIGEKDYFVPFPLDSEIVLSKMDLEITNFLFLRKYNLEDIDFVSYEVSTEDMYIDIFFAEEVDSSTQNIKPQIEVSFIPVSFQPATPLNFYGTLVDSNTIEWSWNGVDNCGYRLYDQDDKIVAEMGIDVRLHLEVSLVAGVNHTRRITSFNEHGESISSNFITVEVPLIELASSIEIRENTLSKTNTKEISPVEEDIESMPAFKSGVGDNLDLLVNAVEELTVNERFQFDIMLEGYSHEMQKHYTAIPFTYKVSASGKRYIDGVVDTDIATKIIPWPVCNVNYIMKSYIYNPFVHTFAYKVRVKYDVVDPRIIPTVSKPIFKDMYTIDGRTLQRPELINIQSISGGPEVNLLDIDVSTVKDIEVPHAVLIEQLEDDDTWVSDGEILPEDTTEPMTFATKGIRLDTTTEGSINDELNFEVISTGTLGPVYVYPPVYKTLYTDIIYTGTATVNSPETDKLLVNLLTYVSADSSLADAKPGSISIVSATLTSSNSNVSFKVLNDKVYATCVKNQNFYEYNRSENLNLAIENGKVKEIVQPSEVKLINMYSNQYVGAKLPTTVITYNNVSPFVVITDGQGNVRPITITNRFPSLTTTLKTPTDYFICSAQLKDEITFKKITFASMFSGLVASEYTLEVIDLSSRGAYTFFTDKTTDVVSGLLSKYIRIDNAPGTYIEFVGTPGKALMHWLEESVILNGTVNGREPMRKNEDGKRDFVSVAPSFDMSIETIDPVFNVQVIDAGGKIIDVRCRNQFSYGKTLVNGDVIVFSSEEFEMVETYGKWTGPSVRVDELEITTSGIMPFYTNIYNPLFDYSVQNMDISEVRITAHSLNPNVKVNPVNTDIIDFASEEYRNTLKIPFLFEAKILSPSQNAWSPVIIPGHYYINNEEYFIHANPKSKGINYVTTTPVIKSFYASIKAGIETKADASAFTKVMNSRSSFSAGTKELVIINDTGTISLVQTGTEAGYPTYAAKGYYTTEPLSFHEAVMLLETDIVCSNRSFTKLSVCYESNGIWSPWQPATLGVIVNFGENADQFKIKIELDRISVQEAYSYIITDKKKSDWLLAGHEATNMIMEENLMVLKDASIPGLYVSPIFTIDMSLTETFKLVLDMNHGLSVGYEYKIFCATSTTIEGIETSVADWKEVTTTLADPIVANTYMRYKIEMPINSKIALNAVTKVFVGHIMRQSSPIVSSIIVTSETPEWMFVGYVNKSILCKVPMDEEIHNVTDYDILDVIYPDILASGISNPRIKSLEIFIVDTTVEISFEQDGNTPLKAKTLSSDSVSMESIYVCLDDNGIGQLAPIPQLGRPVIAIHKDRGPLRHVTFFDDEGELTLTNTEVLRYDGRNSLSLGYTRIDTPTLIITNGRDGSIIPIKKIINNNVYFGDTFNAQIDDDLICKYMIRNSFTVDYNFDLDTNRAQILVHLEKDTPVADLNGIEMFYEIDDYSDYYATELELNPLYNDISTGFIYLTHEDNIPKNIEIKMNPEVFDANGTDCAYMFIKVTDQIGNPVSNISVQVSSGYGKILLTDNITNKFGVVTAKYFSPDYECEDTLIATTTEYDVTSTKKLLIKKPTTRIFVTAVSNVYTIAQGDSISIEAKVFSEDLVPYAAQDMTLFLANYYGDSVTMNSVTDSEGKCYFDVIPLINTANNVSRIEITSMGIKEYIDIKEVI